MNGDVLRTTIEERVTPGKRLGRHIVHDPRSRNFPAEQAPAIVSVTHKAVGLPLNQGDIGSCTANALCGALNSAPDFTGGERRATSRARSISTSSRPASRATRIRRTTRAAAGSRSARPQSSWDGSRRTSTPSVSSTRCSRWCLRPVITGINWYTSFDTPDADGLVAIATGATVRGGHEVVADQIDAPNKLVWFWNSWGKAFGVGGRFCMSFDTWQQLLEQTGDVTVPP